MKTVHNQQTADDWIVCLIEWFDLRARALPWRRSKDPYRIWLSEIMLQQTQVQTVIPYFERFLSAFPTVSALAEANEQDVFKIWEGLGYYSRARNLLKAAKIVHHDHQGKLPDQKNQLLALPGIGPYTAGAILSIAFGKPVPAVDGNVVRVLSRITATAWDLKNPKDRQAVQKVLEQKIPDNRPGDFNEAVMDLGATVCLPQNPQCHQCPLQSSCRANLLNQTADFPVKSSSRPLPVEDRVLIIISSGPLVHVLQRPDTGLLAGLYTFDWLKQDSSVSALNQSRLIEMRASPIVIGVQPLPDLVHRFTHLIWSIKAHWFQISEPNLSPFLDHLDSSCDVSQQSAWVSKKELKHLPLPKAMHAYREIVLDSSTESS